MHPPQPFGLHPSPSGVVSTGTTESAVLSVGSASIVGSPSSLYL